MKLLLKPSKQWLYLLTIFAVGLLAYSAVLVIGIPSTVSFMLLTPDSTFLFIVILFLLFYFAYCPSGWIGTLTSFSATLILFALQLSTVWSSGGNNSLYLQIGLFPVSDARHYYSGALNLLEGGRLSVIASRRPLFSGVLATLLGLIQQNLQVTLAILVLISAISCFLLAREVQRSHGTVAGALVLTTTYLFYREFIGSAMTENLGLALGAIGLAIIWRGAFDQKIYLCLFGILMLTLALNARAGTFFILPALILWGAWSFRGSSRFSSPFLLGGVSFVIFGFILNSIVFKAISSFQAGANSNFSYSLYGLIVGGNWTTIFTEHPEVQGLSDVEKGKTIYALALKAFLDNPLSLVSGSFRAWEEFLWDGVIFSFVDIKIVNVSLQFLSLIALINCYYQRQKVINSLIIASTIGILLSVPFVPPWDAGTRAYAATIPFICLLPALGITFIFQRMKWHQLIQTSHFKIQSWVLLIFGISLILLIVGGPISVRIATKIWGIPRQFPELSCPVDQEVIYFRNSPGSSINLVADDAIQKTYLPNIRINDFQTGVFQYYKRNFPQLQEIPQPIQELMNLSEGLTLINKMNLKKQTNIWVIADSRLIPKENGIVGSCGKTSNTGRFYADSIKLISR